MIFFISEYYFSTAIILTFYAVIAGCHFLFHLISFGLYSFVIYYPPILFITNQPIYSDTASDQIIEKQPIASLINQFVGDNVS
ncbi:hypothetical protein XENE109146_12770 [Xenorhabdus nematophila]